MQLREAGASGKSGSRKARLGPSALLISDLIQRTRGDKLHTREIEQTFRQTVSKSKFVARPLDNDKTTDILSLSSRCF